MLIVGAGPAAAAPPAAATGMMVAVRGQALVDGEQFTIGDGTGLSRTFEFDSDASAALENVAIAFSATDNASQIATRITAAINSTTLAVTASRSGSAMVWLANHSAGSQGNVAVFESVAAPEFVVSGMSGGTDAGSPDVATASTGMIVAVRAQWLVDGETFTIGDGAGLTMTFEFDNSGLANPENTAIPFGPTDNANTLANRIRAAIDLTPLAVSVSRTGAAVWIVNDHEGPAGNVPILESVAAPEFSALGMSGGKDATVAVGPVSPTVTPGVRAFPNPFRSTTLIELGAHMRCPGVLRVLNVDGSVVRRLTFPDGLPSQVRWDGRDARGRELPQGVYFFEITSAGASPSTGRLIKLR